MLGWGGALTGAGLRCRRGCCGVQLAPWRALASRHEEVVVTFLVGALVCAGFLERGRSGVVASDFLPCVCLRQAA